MLYSLVGIPFCLVFISALGRQLFNASQRLCIKASCCRHRKWIPLLAYILLGSVPFIWMTAAIFGFVENWSYSDAVYYTFITLSTIGFGDFIPGRCCAIYQHRIRMKRMLDLFLEAFFHRMSSVQNCSSGNRTNRNQLVLILHFAFQGEGVILVTPVNFIYRIIWFRESISVYLRTNRLYLKMK